MASISSKVNEIINKLNNELNNVAFKIHQNGIGLLHMYAMNFTWMCLREFNYRKLLKDKY